MVDEGDDEKFRGLESGQKLFSKWVDLYLDFVSLHFKREYPDFWEHQRLQQFIEITRSIIQRRIVVLCKTFEAVTRGSGYVLSSSCFCVLSSGGMVSGTLDYVICVG
jgi:hypothetical protein